MPLTSKGEKIKAALVKEYGEKKGEQVLYAGKNAGTFTGIDSADDVGSLIDAVIGLCDAIDDLRWRMDAYHARRIDAAREAEHKLTVKFDGDFNAAGFVQHLHHLGSIGASRTVVAMDADDKPVKFGWDGDGADKIIAAELDGKSII